MNTLSRQNPSTSPLERVIDDLFNEPFFFAAPTRVLANNVGRQASLALDVSEDETSYIVRANVPGFTREQVEVSAHDGVLSIRANRDEEREEKAERYHRRERVVSAMERSLSLPGDIVDEKTTAELKDGVLTVRLAKSPKALPRKIAVK